jgi:tRNA(Ile)-lysidine synthase
VAVGHQLEDQAETILDHFLRGAGAAGLVGLREIQELSFEPRTKPLKVWRPLLNVPRKELRDYLKERGIPWREDRSNWTDRYRRNQIRRKVIPFLRKWNPNLILNLARLSEIASAEDAFLESVVKALHSRLSMRARVNERKFRADLLSKEALALQRRWLRAQALELNPAARGMRFDRIQEALRVLGGQMPGPRDLGYGLSIIKDGRFGTLRWAGIINSAKIRRPRNMS